MKRYRMKENCRVVWKGNCNDKRFCTLELYGNAAIKKNNTVLLRLGDVDGLVRLG